MVQKGQHLSEEDKFLLEWGKESKKENLILANEILGKVATLAATITGGGVVFLNKDIIPEILIFVVLLLFLISLVLAFIGLLPYKANIDLKSPTEIHTYKTNALSHKLKYIYYSATLFILGLCFAVLGVSFKYIFL